MQTNNITHRLREHYRKYDDALVPIPDEDIVLNWEDFKQFLDDMDEEEREDIFKSLWLPYRGLRVMLQELAKPFPETE